MLLFDYLKKFNLEIPHQTALATDDKKWTYEDLYNIVAYNQKHHTLGLHKRVILQIQDQALYMITFLSLLAQKCWLIPVDPKLTKDEVLKIRDFTDATLIITAENNPIHYSLPQETNELSSISEDDAGIYLMTSGSTGEPKFCILNLARLTYHGEAARIALHLTPEDKILNILPLHHTLGLEVNFLGNFVTGSTLYVMKEFHPRQILLTIENIKATLLLLVPFMAQMLLVIGKKKHYDLSSLKHVVCGTGVASLEVHEDFKKYFNIHLSNMYGSSEVGTVLCRLEDKPFNSAGKPMQDIDCKIITAQHTLAAIGEEGEIYIKTKAIAPHYLNDSNSLTDSAGFYNMKDIGMRDELGNIFIKHRKPSVINIAGKKISPLEVQQVINAYPSVNECIVLSEHLKNDEDGIKAVIATTAPISAMEIRDYCLAHLASYKIPSKIVFCTEIPRNTLGKIQYTRLQEL